MAAGSTDNLSFVTLETNDRSTQAWAKTNWETIDAYATARKMTNKSGSQRTAGDVVVVSTGTDDSFTTTTTAANVGVLGVVQETVANDASGLVKQVGVVEQLKVTGATTRGNFLTTSTTAGQAVDSGTSANGTNSAPAGAFAIALESTVGAGTVKALLVTPAPGSLTLSSSTPEDIAATGSAGSSSEVSKADHVHGGVDEIVVIKSATQTVTESTTLVNDTHFPITVAADTDYLVEMTLLISGNNTANWKFAWTLTGMTHDAFHATNVNDANGGVTFVGDAGRTSGTAQAVAISATLTSGVWTGTFIIHSGSTGGTLNFQWAQSTSNASNVSVLKNSVMKYRVLGAT